MFSQLARLGVTRAAAFFYAVAVGVVANVLIAHLSPHDDILATAPPAASPQSTTAAGKAPAAIAVIAPKPVEPAKPIEVSAPATVPNPLPPPVMTVPPMNPAALPAVPAPTPPPLPASVAATLPTPASLAPPPLKPAAFPVTPATPSALQTPAAPAPAASDGKPAPDKAAINVEAAASANSAAPVSLLPPPDPPADPPAPKKPGPGSGGLY